MHYFVREEDKIIKDQPQQSPESFFLFLFCTVYLHICNAGRVMKMQLWPTTLLTQLLSPAKLMHPVYLCYDKFPHLLSMLCTMLFTSLHLQWIAYM